MSRTDSLYARLDELELELAERLVPELEAESKGGASLFIARLMTPYFAGSQYETPEVQVLERLTKEVLTLKEKLGEATSRKTTAVVSAYLKLREQATPLLGEDRREFGVARLAELKEWQQELADARRLTRG